MGSRAAVVFRGRLHEAAEAGAVDVGQVEHHLVWGMGKKGVRGLASADDVAKAGRVGGQGSHHHVVIETMGSTSRIDVGVRG